MPAAKLLLIDGNNLVHRAYHALPPLTVRRTGEVVNAVYGFASMLLKVLAEQKPTHYAIAFDKKGPTFRHYMYEAYKAGRPKMAEDLSPQMERVRELVRQFNIPIYEAEGYEADDVLGTLAKQASAQGVETLILTGDADAMQLVGDGVGVLYPRAGRSFSETALYDAAGVKEKFGVGPERVADFKALVGDPSDNIPGVHGVGDKTAAKLIEQYGGIDDIYAHLSEVAPPRLQGLLQEGEYLAHQSLELATIDRGAPVTLDLAATRASGYNREQVVALFRDLEFFTLLNRLPEEETVGAEARATEAAAPVPAPRPVVELEKDYKVINDQAGLAALARRLTGPFALEAVTTGGSPLTTQLVGLALSPAPGKAYYIPLTHASLDAGPQLPLSEVAQALAPALTSTSIARTAHHANFASMALHQHGFAVAPMSFDTMLAAHLLGEASLELKSLVLSRLGVELPDLPLGSGAKKQSVAQLPVPVVGEYAALAVDMVGRLPGVMTPELKRQELWSLFSEVEMPLVPVLVAMQREGVQLDCDLLKNMSVALGDRLLALEGEIYKLAHHEFNLNSPRQLGTVLFEELHLPTDKRRGGWSTEASVLEGLRAYQIVEYILEYRSLSKLKSTYIDALPALVNPHTGRLHTSFNQTRTSTGRLSSSDPNLQNIPVRGELGREIRCAFTAREGTVFLSGDYSQIDLRVLAHLSQDPLLLATFTRGEDVHTATAVRLFAVAPEEVTADMRRLAKTVNFGVIYGMSGYGLEQATELTHAQAEKFIEAYFAKYPGVRDYLEATKKRARERGYVQTVLGRRRYVPEIHSPNRMVREAGERMAINMPVQGTSADIIKLAMLDLDEAIRKRGLQSKLLLQVHDELIWEVPEAELPVMQEIVPPLMENALKLSVPIKVDTKTARRWGEME